MVLLKNKKIALRVMCYGLHEKGFTLAEMMIVIAIIGIFSSLTIVNFRGNDRARQLDSQSLLLLDGIKRIQTSSLTGRVINGGAVSAYRFEIDKCSSGCSYELMASTTSGMIPFDNVLLDSSAVDIIDSTGSSIGNNLIVDIFPPRGDMEILINDVPVVSEAILKIEHIDDNSISKKIKINKISGRMDVLND